MENNPHENIDNLNAQKAMRLLKTLNERFYLPKLLLNILIMFKYYDITKNALDLSYW